MNNLQIIFILIVLNFCVISPFVLGFMSKYYDLYYDFKHQDRSGTGILIYLFWFVGIFIFLTDFIYKIVRYRKLK